MFSHLFPPRNDAGYMEIYNRVRRRTFSNQDEIPLNERNYKTYKLDDQPKRTRPDFSSFPVQSPAFVRSSYLTILILISRNDLYCVEKLLGWCIFYFFSNKCFFSLLNHIYIYTISKYFPLIIIISYRQVNYSISYLFFFNPVNFKI